MKPIIRSYFILAAILVFSAGKSMSQFSTEVLQNESYTPGHDGVAKVVFTPSSIGQYYNVKWYNSSGNEVSNNATATGLESGYYDVFIYPFCSSELIRWDRVYVKKSSRGGDDDDDDDDDDDGGGGNGSGSGGDGGSGGSGGAGGNTTNNGTEWNGSFPVEIIATTPTTVECNQKPTVMFHAEACCGTPPYTYEWSYDRGFGVEHTDEYDAAHFIIRCKATDAEGRISNASKEFYLKKIKCPEDPNELEGPEGYTEEFRYVNADRMNYSIGFENDPEMATAPASRVYITYDIPPEQDITSIRLGSFGFGDRVYSIPLNVSTYRNRLDLNDSLGLFVDVTAGVDVLNGRLFWIFQSIDPVTGFEPAESDRGFLPVNDEYGTGEGFVSFSILPSAEVRTGDVVEVNASIVFDANNAISTNTWMNTFDVDAPVSSLSATFDETISRQCTFSFSSSDGENGSGVDNVELWVSINNGVYEFYSSCNPDDGITFDLEEGNIYDFVSRAVDNAGNKEPLKNVPDTSFSENNAPIDILLVGTSFFENSPLGTPFGTVMTMDDVPTTVYNYSLVQGVGDDDNELFSIVDDKLITNANFSCSQNESYSVRIRSTDLGGLSVEKSFLITMIRENTNLQTSLNKVICSGSSLQFGEMIEDTEGIYHDTLSSFRGCDSIVSLTLYVLPSYYDTIVAEACDEMLWYDSIYVETTSEAKRYMTTTRGCDSIELLHLTINYSNDGVETVTACNSYVWHGVEYTISTNLPTYTCTNAVGCDSVTTLNLTINQCSTTEITACDSYTWRGIAYTESGIYVDGTDTLFLTINYSTSSTETIVACDSITWHGSNFAASNDNAQFSTLNTVGCDSTVTLNLTINYSTVITDSLVVCDSYAWNGTVYTTSDLLEYHSVNATGCDSTAILKLTVKNSVVVDTQITSMDSFTWNGVTYTESGIYSFTNIAFNGCDSVVWLSLIVTSSSNGVFGSDGGSCSYFSVGEGNAVRFSKGNLQYNAALGNHATADGGTAQGTWRFAEHQWDIIGDDNSNISPSYSGWIDLFGWGTSGWNSGATAHQPYSTSMTYTDYYPGGADSNDLAGTYAFADWGVYNAISNGGNTPNMWRTLTIDEWLYLLYVRPASTVSNTENARFTAAIVNDIPGIIIFPDVYVHPDSVAIPDFNYAMWRNSHPNNNVNVYTYYDWSKMENAGCVFIPAAGSRQDTSVFVPEEGGSLYYWSSSHEGFYPSNTSAGTVSMSDNEWFTDYLLEWNTDYHRYYGFSVRLVTPYNTTSSIDTIVVECDSFTWHGIEYTNTPTIAPSHTYTNAIGCDSIVTLNLTINNSTYDTIDVTTCDRYTWYGEMKSESGEYIYHTTNAAGCDSMVTLNLTVNYSNSDIETVTACNSFVWHGTEYTTSTTTPTYTTENADGCDSVTTLHLTINRCSTTEIAACDSYIWHDTNYTVSGIYHDDTDTLLLTVNYSNTATENVTVCDSYTWHGTTFIASTNTATFVGTNIAGCDSTTTLNLIVNYSNTGIDQQTACDSYTWIDSNIYTTSNSTAQQTLTNAVGCDSTVTLNLTINYSNSAIETVSACNSYVWHGIEYTASTNSPLYTCENAFGCDSTTTLHLNVNACSTTEITACDNYTWHGNTYSTSGIYYDGTDTLLLTINYSSSGIENVTSCDSYIWHGIEYISSTNLPTFTCENVAGCDSVTILYLTINYSSTGDTMAVACDSFTWWHSEITESTEMLTHTYTNAAGCDSTVTLHLTVNYSNSTTETVTACNSYVWHGTEYIASTDLPTYTTLNAAGCDSVTTLNLTVLPCSTTQITSCDSYTWHSNTYSTSGIYYDGTDTLLLTINYSNSGIENVTSCDSYIWHGIEYTSSTDLPTFNCENVAGCDSVTTLHLTINYSSMGDTMAVACDSFTWWNTEITESSEMLTHTYTNSAGCDSLVTLHLIVNYSSTGVETVTSCNSYVWHGTEYIASTDLPTYTTLNAAGCDSVTTLNLTVLPCSTTQITSCDSYTWHGSTYSTSGIYYDGTDTLLLTINYSNSGIENVTSCDSYIWHGIEYTSSTDLPTFTCENVAGCDSVTTLHLTINYSSMGDTMAVVCDSFTWWNTEITESSEMLTHTYTNSAGCDSLVTLHLTVNYSSTGVETVTACNSYVWHGTEYIASTDLPTYTTLNAAGCDSVTTLNLTVLPCSTTQITSCDSYTWHGNTYVTSGTYADGADTLLLTVNYSNTGTEIVTTCDSYLWHGTNYTASIDTATYTTSNAAGCDSITTLNLTVNYSSASTMTDTACDSYAWHGITYTASGTFAYQTTNAVGCDSTVTLHLTVNHGMHNVLTETACNSYVWHETEYSASGDYTYSYTNSDGCPSDDTLHLTINYSVETTVADTASGSYTWNGSTYTESGTYQWQGTTTEGCDSTVTLLLVINSVGIEIIDGNGMVVNVYPNPTTGWITIDADDVLSVEVFDQAGRHIVTHDNTNRINLGGLVTGNYLLKIHLQRGGSVQRVILK